MSINIEDILKENERRLSVLFAPYDPIEGTGGLIERKSLVIDDLGMFYLPLPFFDDKFGALLEEKKCLSVIAEENDISVEDVFNMFIHLRCKWDFEFWCAYAVKIKPKQGGDFISFVLNAPQRRLHSLTFRDIVAGNAIKQIICKSRQWGGSTCKQVEMLWIQEFHCTNWNSLIAAHINQASTNIRSMITNVALRYPSSLGKISIKPFEGTKNIKIMVERSNKITIGSMETPESIRSDDVKMAHLSEVGLWKKTEGKEPEDLVQAILGTIPDLPFTMYALESTAKGVGNFFHKTWQLAVSEGADNNGLTPIFVSWIEDKNNIKRFRDEDEKVAFYNSLSKYELFLWESGATLEGIYFYRTKLKSFNNNTWRMCSEFPTTADEAFQSTGNPVFDKDDIKYQERNCKSPIFIGDVKSLSRSGKEAFKDIRLVDNSNGYLWIWNMPEPIIELDGKKYLVANRYCGFADIGGKGTKADYSELTIVDKYWMVPEIGGAHGIPEIAAQWHGHLDQDLFAWQCAILGWHYGKMLLAIEANKLNKVLTEGDHFLTVLNEIKDFYPNLYARVDKQAIDEKLEKNWGWWETHQSKVLTVDFLFKLLRDRGYVERDLRALAQMKTFEHKPDGTMGAVEGEKDDMVTTRKGSLYLAIIDSPKPYLVPVVDSYNEGKRSNGNKRIISEATI